MSPTCSARPSLAPSACAAVSSTSSGSRSGASGTQKTPSGYWSTPRRPPGARAASCRFRPARSTSAGGRLLEQADAPRRALARARGRASQEPAGSSGAGSSAAGSRRSRAGRSRSGAARSFSRCSPRSRKLVSARERCGRRRDEHLAAVPGRGDAGRAVDVRADVALVGDVRRARCGCPCAPGSGPPQAPRALRPRRRARPAPSGRR